ncbi:MAG: hypothetical protein ABI990_06835 [Actinomycetota bacterium]
MSGVPLGPSVLASLYAAELPQKDQLCGAFWGSLALRAFGFLEASGESVDQDAVAREAGTALAGGDPAQWVPPGASPRGDHRLAFPAASDEASGSASTGVSRAIDVLSGGALRAVPVAGHWDAARVVVLLRELEGLGEAVVPIANVRTASFWGSHADPGLLLDVLAGRAVTEPPPPDWDVGHFVGLALLVEGPGGALVGVRDTYEALGAGGYHLQPADALAGALRRGDGKEGGVLCVVAAAEANRLEARLHELGFEVRAWDNGSVPVYAGGGGAEASAVAAPT